MKRSIQTASIFISLFTFLCVSHLQGQEWQTPLIDGYGEIKYFEKLDLHNVTWVTD